MAKIQSCLLMMLVCASCATTPEPEVKGPPEPVFYTLRTAKPIKHESPLPNKISIYVDWKMSDGSTVSKEGFRGWDIDHDGKFDVLEVLSEDGVTTSWVYDFNGDGKVDAVEKTGPEGIPVALGSSIVPEALNRPKLLQLSH